MQLSKFVVLSIAGLFSSSGEACKCYGTNGNLNNGATHKCCNDYHGVYSGNDCKASSISEHLSGFDRCCKGQGSDCDFPGRAAALGQEMRAVKHVEIKTDLAK
ncbi:glycosyltransferase family 90 [Fusarium circinatum]|uniref:Glycosyltransferase family 90 n=1 Tax=Fusarium circinatum TaxID=48490 RepID=A0A8H5WPJ5_FUSCI|nr:glycosyltransferase family 90 [Fusarium circinatum]